MAQESPLAFGPFQLESPPGRLWRGPEGPALLAVLRRYAPMWLAQLPGLVSDPELERVQRQVQRATQARMLRELAEAHLAGVALPMQGDAAAGVAHLRQGLGSHDVGPEHLRPHWLALLAEAYGRAGQPDAGLQVLAEAVTLMTTTEMWWSEAEMSRLQGELQLQLASPDVSQAEACFQQALAVARSQQAKSLELRAALSLARLWQQQGRRQAARALLAPVYSWFTEGFDTADLQEAKVLLEALA